MLLKQIEYFHAVVDSGNFYDAADACHVSQSAVSQQIKKLEEELGVQLLTRHNRTFSLTPAGEHFYRKSMIIRSELEQLIRETKKIDAKDTFALRLGYYKGYHGNEFPEAVGQFSQKYPAVSISIKSGSHEDLFHDLQNEQIDFALSDQRRAFSNAYNNVILSDSTMYIEISSRSPIAALDYVEVSDLRNIPCILIANASQQKDEQEYYDQIIGLHGDFLFAETLQDARLKIITGQGFLPVDVIGKESWFDTAVSRIPLLRNGEAIHRNYCAFWKKDNSGYYIEEFAEMLEELFR